MGLGLGPRARVLVGAVTVGLWAGIATMTWDGLRWVSIGAMAFAALRGWLWLRQLRAVFASDEEEEEHAAE